MFTLKPGSSLEEAYGELEPKLCDRKQPCTMLNVFGSSDQSDD